MALQLQLRANPSKSRATEKWLWLSESPISEMTFKKFQQKERKILESESNLHSGCSGNVLNDAGCDSSNWIKSTSQVPPVQRHHEIATRWDPSKKWHVLRFLDEVSTFYISRSHLDVGFQRACEATGESNSSYYSKSVKCLCSGNSNWSFPLTWKKILLTYMVTPYPVSFWTARSPVGAKWRLLFSQDWYSKWEPQNDQNHTKKYKKFSESYVHFLP